MAILALVVVPAIFAAILWPDRPVFAISGLVVAVGCYAAWDLQRVVVDPATMSVESITVSQRLRTFAITLGWTFVVVGAWCAWGAYIGSLALAYLGAGAFIVVAIAQGVHLFVTDTGLQPGHQQLPSPPEPPQPRLEEEASPSESEGWRGLRVIAAGGSLEEATKAMFGESHGR